MPGSASVSPTAASDRSTWRGCCRTAKRLRITHKSLFAIDSWHDIIARGVSYLPPMIRRRRAGRREGPVGVRGDLSEQARTRMTQPAKSQEPSMEEILASIRRIIADDDANKTAPRPAEPPPQAVAPPPAARPAPPPQAPPPPPRVAPPAPSIDEAVAADPEPMAEVEDQASDILD